MSKKRVFELAKEIGISSKELMDYLKKINVEVKSHMNILEDKTVVTVIDKFTQTSHLSKEIPKQEVTKEIIQQPKIEEKKKEESPKQEEKIVPEKEKPVLKINESITTGELAKKININSGELIKKLIELGKMVTINQKLDNDTIAIVVDEYGYTSEIVPIFEDETILLEQTEKEVGVLEKRPPVITMMGHVDHGKTSLLDAIRKTNVTAGEAGGITQHIGAYTVKLPKGEVVFLDTPGHAAFTAMRARGAKVTDIVILIVAADDGVMPQTIEAVDHAKEAGVTVIVAINKIDKPDANPDKVKQELAKVGLIPEDWGGKTIFVDVSAKKYIGIDNLLEMILLQAEMLELKANANKKAVGTVVEAELDRGRGAVATILVKEGTLKLGDNFVSGLSYGRVRAMINDKGERIKSAGPSIPVEVLGFTTVPLAGDNFIVVNDERTAREIGLKRQDAQANKKLHPVRHISLDELYNEIQKGKIKELKVIIKADVQGSIEPLKDSLEQISNEKVKLVSIHTGVGNVNESDVMLAAASDAVIIGFHVKVETEASRVASEEGVDIRLYEIIYEVVNDIKSAMEGLLEPTTKELVVGRAEIRKVIKSSKEGIVVGVMVLNGKITRGDNVRVIRKTEVLFTGKLNSLRRFKDDVKEVSAGYECGIGFENFTDLKEMDVIETFTLEKVKQKL